MMQTECIFWCNVVGWKGQGLLYSDTTQMLGCDFNIWQRLATILNWTSL